MEDEERFSCEPLVGNTQLDAIALLASQNGYLANDKTDFTVIRSADSDGIVAVVHKLYKETVKQALEETT